MLFLILFVCSVLLIIGLSDIIHNINLCLLKIKDINNNTLICFLEDNSAELNLRYVIEQKKWHGNSFAGRIIAINNIKSQETINKCKNLAQRYEIDFFTLVEFINLLKSEI